MDISFRRLRPRIRSGCRSNPLGVARCCPHLESVVKQMSDDPATEKPGSAENRDEPAMAGCPVCRVFCHGRQLACPPARFESSVPHEAERLHLSMLGRPSCQRASRSARGMNVERKGDNRPDAEPARGSERRAGLEPERGSVEEGVEKSKGAVSKSVVPLTGDRKFESLSVPI
jgi:hypothetical protein